MKTLIALLVLLCLLVAAGAVFVWSGVYNIAANVPHWKITHEVLSLVRERSISAHSKGITIPPLKDPRLLDRGFKNYHEMCRLCHNAPGYSRTVVAQGLYPAPPDFTSKNREKQSNAEVYWIVKNGIKMTGMAAFGATHSEEEILGLVFFVQRLRDMTPKEYAAMLKAAGLQKREGHHH